MANIIKIKRSAEQGKVPLTSNLELGELAINTNDGKLFLKRDNGTAESIVEVGADTLATVTALGASTNTECSFLSGISTNIVKQTQGTIQANSATTTLNFNLYGNFYVSLSANTTLSFSNLNTNIGSSGYIFLKQDATGGRTITFPSQAKTPGGRTFTQNTTANSLSMITFYVVDADTVVVNYIADFK